MRESINESKAVLRRQIRELLKGLDGPRRLAASGQACERLKKQAVWREAKSILFYAPLPEELDIWPIIDGALTAGKIIALLRYSPGGQTYEACRIQDPLADLQSGPFAIREPNPKCQSMPLGELDLVLVPGVAFDLSGHRLGRGRGIFDRLLMDVRGVTCGVAFDEQIVPEIPVETHDIHVKCLLTPTRWVTLG